MEVPSAVTIITRPGQIACASVTELNIVRHGRAQLGPRGGILDFCQRCLDMIGIGSENKADK